ncbi:hypothetical protein ONZ45_g16481 [Pleurotus djamor]|nr:hypothetical protein ONZ45_g16481 [Pleurotus djamor]
MSSTQPTMPSLRTPENANPLRLPKPATEDTKSAIRRALFGCPHHDLPGKRKRRNLIVNIDGTLNQFSIKSTNVVELFSRIIKIIYNRIDTAIAWNFEKIIHAAYKWLSENYEPGDRIFLFGFSRGAYQVRVIAGMIEKVGLLHKGNENQIAFAYELYTALTAQTRGPTAAFPSTEPTDAPGDPASSEIAFKAAHLQTQATISQEEKLCRSFKRSLCHEDVKVHFVGAWDTVSSIGVFRGNSFPETASGMGHVCHFRHTLALDERRAKFQPEYVNGGLGPDLVNPTGDVKEVWFKGTHSDIGGGNMKNEDLNNFSDSLRWMTYEAQYCGLMIKPYTGNWIPVTPKESLTWVWMILEFIPFGALAYINKDSLTWWPHLGRPRKIQPGQLIHQSVFGSLLPKPNLNSQIAKVSEAIPYRPKALLYPSLEVSDWTDLFTVYSFVPGLSIIEPDPFQNASHVLSSLSQASDALMSEEGDQGSALNALTASIQTLQSFVNHPTRLSSLLEVHDAGYSLIKAVTVAASNTTVKLTRESKETLIRLLSCAWPASRELPPDFYRISPSTLYQWGSNIRDAQREAFLKVIQTFACLGRLWGGEWISNIAFSQTDETKIIFTSSLDRATSTLLWDGSIEPPKEIVKDATDVSIINITSQPPLVIKGTDVDHGGDIYCLCFSNNNQLLATGYPNGYIKLWRREDDQWKVFERFYNGDEWIRQLAFSRDDSKLVLVAVPMKVWNLEDKTIVALGDSLDSWSLAWSPSGSHIAAGTGDGILKIWSPDWRTIKHTFKAHDCGIQCVAFRDDERVLATGSDDHRIRIWRWGTWEKNWEFNIGEWVLSVAFSPDGTRLVSGGWQGALHLWDVDMDTADGEPMEEIERTYSPRIKVTPRTL